MKMQVKKFTNLLNLFIVRLRDSLRFVIKDKNDKYKIFTRKIFIEEISVLELKFVC